MTNSPQSGSDPSANFNRLNPEIRRWIWEQNWEELRDVQDRAISSIFDADIDVLISASTASGKTEAAMLPILTQIADRTSAGLSVLYVSPLKALINDQFRRLEPLCERLDIDVVRWHGDAPLAAKKKTLKNPRGLALITPESIEALFVRRPAAAYQLFGSLDFVVVDELHAFLHGLRGLHLASLLRRIDELSTKRARRVGLSATIGDLSVASTWLNCEKPETVAQIVSSAGGPELRLQIRAYLDPVDVDDIDALEEEGAQPIALDQIADHLFETLRGANNLVFAGSRRRVESLADRLRLRSEMAGMPNEFYPHHGSLAKNLREEAEERLKTGDLPTTAITTTTLELGIDIGSVKSVAQVGAPRSIGSLRQRLGRSGRRKGAPAVLRIYVREHELATDADPLDRLRLEVIRAVAAVRLLVSKFIEPPIAEPSVATVIIHQILSVIAERGGARADRLYQTICGGTLAAFQKTDFIELLRTMAAPAAKLIEQAPDGLIMLGENGERVVSGRDFFAVFQSDEEWRLVSDGRTLGTIPIANAFGVGSLLAFAGRRWRVTAVDDNAKVLEVTPHRAARIPKFESLMSEALHDRFPAEMHAVYESDDVPPYLDAAAAALLSEGRSAYREMNLSNVRLIAADRDTHVMLWRGTALNAVFAMALQSAGLQCSVHDIGVTVTKATPAEVAVVIKTLGAASHASLQQIADFVDNLRSAKFDEFAPEALLRRIWRRNNASEISEIPAVAMEILNQNQIDT